MIQHEITDRDSKRLAQRLRWAKLPQSAALEDLDTRTPRGIDPKLIAMLAAFAWIKEKLNVLITGPCGVGKSFISNALRMPPVVPTTQCVRIVYHDSSRSWLDITRKPIDRRS